MVIGTVAERIDSQQTEDPPEQIAALPTGRGGVLRECVCSTVGPYLKDLDGYEVNDLYRLVMSEVEPPLCARKWRITRSMAHISGVADNIHHVSHTTRPDQRIR